MVDELPDFCLPPSVRLRGANDDWSRLRGRVAFATRAQILEIAVALSRPVAGNIIEFGVFEGESIRILRDEVWRSRVWDRRLRRTKIYACDSFRGLPAGYESLSEGTFATPVPRLTGVRVVPGYFEDSLTPGLAEEVTRVRLAHFDADLYDSTLTALNWITPLLTSGSLLLFDEYLGDDPAEARAFEVWAEHSGLEVALLLWAAREPSGRGSRTDWRALYQVVGAEATAPRPLLPIRIRRWLTRRV